MRTPFLPASERKLGRPASKLAIADFGFRYEAGKLAGVM